MAQQTLGEWMISNPEALKNDCKTDQSVAKNHTLKIFESSIQKQLIKWLEQDGWYVIKLIQTNRNGIPDLVCHKTGRTIYIEVKREGKELRPLQQKRHTELYEHGIETWVIDSVDELLFI